MLLHIPGVLDAQQLAEFDLQLAQAGEAWVDGRVTAGSQGAAVKKNQQLAEHAPLAIQLGNAVLAVLERNALFISASLPHRVYPPMFNRYEGGMTFGDHIDNAVRVLPGSATKIRTDLSATLFLSNPQDYDGGELVVEAPSGTQRIKLAAGDLILYPSSSLHRVTPVTRGVRLACFFWVQSMVRSDAQRALLFDMDRSIQKLTATNADMATRVQLTGCYHNLLRMWTEL
ncbi:MAG: Fe2+-dependent dioxygenase [Pseudomonadota bacterium]